MRSSGWEGVLGRCQNPTDFEAAFQICEAIRTLSPFTTLLRSEGIEVKGIAPSAPEMNGHSESFVGTLKRECLDHFIISSSTEHMDRLCQRYAEFYNTVRPHRRSTMARLSPRGITCPAIASTEDLACESWLGGVLRHYSWKGAA
jgi:hypothetical protein